MGLNRRRTVTNSSGESYYDDHYIYLIDPSQTGSQNNPADLSDQPASPIKPADLLGTLEGPAGILAALAFLSIPLVFAIATDSFRGQTLTRASLMRSFFIQCYYFSPFGLVAWSLIIGVEYLLTPLQVGLVLLSLAVVLYMFMWLVRNETNLIARERGIRRIYAFLIVSVCLGAILGAAMLVTLLQASPELLRISLGWLYSGVISALTLSAVAHWLMRRRGNKDEAPKE